MGGFVSGLIMTGDIEMAHIYGRNGFFMGMGMGLVSGAMSGYVYAKSHKMHPWNGKYTEPLYHYTTEDNANTILNTQLGIDDNSLNYLTPDGNKSPLQAQLDLALPQSNNAEAIIQIKPNSIYYNDIILQRPVTGNVYMRPGGGYEIIHKGTIAPQNLKLLRIR